MQSTLPPVIAALLGCVSVWFAVNGVAALVGSRSKTARLKRRIDSSGTSSGEAPKVRGLGPLLAGFAGHLGERMAPKDEHELSNTSFSLQRAGYYNANAAKIFWGVKIAVSALGILTVALAKLLTGFSAQPPVMALLLLFPAVVGIYLPNVWLKTRISKRRNQIQRSLPDALDLMVVCVESGMGLDQAINRVSSEMRISDPILSHEFKLVILELRAGKARAEALKNLARRVNLEDVNSLVTLIIQSDSFGTSIAKTLRVYSDAMRTTRYQRAEEIASKLPVKILFPLILFILPALFVVLIGPAGIKLMDVFTKMPS
jgi:tight adherence protein C